MVNITVKHHVTNFEYLLVVADSIVRSNSRIMQQKPYRDFIGRQVEASKELEVLRRELEELEKE